MDSDFVKIGTAREKRRGKLGKNLKCMQSSTYTSGHVKIGYLVSDGDSQDRQEV